MKKIISFFLIFTVVLSLNAQPRHHQHEKRQTNIVEMVDDLSASQRKQLLKAQSETHERIDALYAKLDGIRDSIRLIMHKEGDYSKDLFPLFDREAIVQAQISKEMYSLRVFIDNILTPKQLEQFRSALKRSKRKP